jgi:hypothetical protein
VADRFDVVGRLTEGLAAVDDLQTYVSASRARGYANPDLTLDNSQIRDWYGTEDGLDLSLLDADCAQLAAAANAADEALRIARTQAGALAGAWRGGGGGAAGEFIGRHCTAGATVADAVRSAADAYARLRDELWSVVDRKVAATVSIDDRTQAQRPAWLAAAHAVTAGVIAPDDPSGAVVDSQVKPFVEHDIRGEWLTSMHSATDSAAGAYQAAADAIGSRVGVRFEVPGDLGPRYVPPGVAAAAPVALPAAAADPLGDDWPSDLSWPAAPVDGMSAAAPPPLPAAPLPAAPPLAPPPLDAAAMPTGAPGLSSLPGSGGMPEVGGSGIGGLPGQLADLLGSLFDQSGDPVPDPPELPDDPPELPDDPPLDEPALDPAEEPDGPEDADDAADPDSPDGDCPAEPDTTVAEPVPVPSTPPAPPPPADAEPVTPAPLAAPAAPAAPAVPAVPAPQDGSTPCEIAADELPQAGQ